MVTSRAPRRSAEMATSTATLPPPMTSTFFPGACLRPRWMSMRKSRPESSSSSFSIPSVFCRHAPVARNTPS